MPTLIVLIGPTGVGKTELSLRLAENFQTHIVSADSRQLYAELKIGTAAPTPEQLERVPHHLVGTLHLTDYYSAAQYETEAMEILEKLFMQHEVVVVGYGTQKKVNLTGIVDSKLHLSFVEIIRTASLTSHTTVAHIQSRKL